jgi:hypothetical protein
MGQITAQSGWIGAVVFQQPAIQPSMWVSFEKSWGLENKERLSGIAVAKRRCKRRIRIEHYINSSGNLVPREIE